LLNNPPEQFYPEFGLSEPLPIGVRQAGSPDVRAAIARASQRTGVDFQYLLAQAKLESSLDPSARAGTSSAAGLYQFTNGTWLKTLDEHGADHGLDWASAAIAGGRVDPAMRAQVMALRYNPDASALMAAELANDNKTELTGVLGREPDSAELYLAHFLGVGGAGQFLSALNQNPGQSAAAILPKAAGANRGIFYDGSGAPRSVAGVMELLRGRVSAAMEGGTPPAWVDYGAPRFAAGQPEQVSGGPIAREFHAARQQLAAAAGSGRQSMADTLRNAFGAGGGDGHAAVPANIRAAYGQLKRFDL
jgi:hypothetical protein